MTMMPVKVPSPSQPKLLIDEAQGSRSLFALALSSLAVGAFTGLIAASFRLALRSADGWQVTAAKAAASDGTSHSS